MRKFPEGYAEPTAGAAAAAPKPKTREYHIHQINCTRATYFYLTYINPSDEKRMREIRFDESYTSADDRKALIALVNDNPNIKPPFTIFQTNEALPQFKESSEFQIEGRRNLLYVANHDTFQRVANRHNDAQDHLTGQEYTQQEILDHQDQRYCRNQVKAELEQVTLKKIEKSFAQSFQRSHSAELSSVRESREKELSSLMTQLGLSKTAASSLQEMIANLQKRNIDLLTENVDLRNKNVDLQKKEDEQAESIAELMTEVARLKQTEAEVEPLYIDARPEKEAEAFYTAVTTHSTGESKSEEIIARLQEQLAQEQAARAVAEKRARESSVALQKLQIKFDAVAKKQGARVTPVAIHSTAASALPGDLQTEGVSPPPPGDAAIASSGSEAPATSGIANSPSQQPTGKRGRRGLPKTPGTKTKVTGSGPVAVSTQGPALP